MAGPVILVAEDREDDVLLIQKALAAVKMPHQVHVVCDGEEAIAYLDGEGRFANREEYPPPDLLLLDLKLPRKDGFEVLQWIRQQSDLQLLRVVVLTSSDDIRDVNEAYQLGANSFLGKPPDLEDFIQLGEFITEYWLRLDRAPQRLPARAQFRGSGNRA